jgi:hypothetical protein
VIRIVTTELNWFQLPALSVIKNKLIVFMTIKLNSVEARENIDTSEMIN